MLEDIGLFAELTASERNTLGMFCQERPLENGELLFSEGDGATAMYVVKEGSLKVYKDRSTGTTILGYVNAGETVGEMAVFGHEPRIRMATVRAVEPTRLLVIVDYAIIEISRKHPELYAKINAIIRRRMEQNSGK
ncbi:MAG: family transcriptional regulator, cyclic receptor protein [Patescibacteria group bacterium]|nr:family transcriptional regulator, cyclic receptor protein [Patescibacteria group bacterium]